MDTNHLLPHTNLHPLDFFVVGFTICVMPFISWIAKFMNENTGVFVSFGALFGIAFTAYRWFTVYKDRQKLKQITKLDNRDAE